MRSFRCGNANVVDTKSFLRKQKSPERNTDKSISPSASEGSGMILSD